MQPRDGHFDRRITVTTPLKEAGAYLLTAKMAGGNESRVILWVADAVIVKKPLEQQTLYYLADAVTGKPLPGVPLDLFGYQQEWIGQPLHRHHRHDEQDHRRQWPRADQHDRTGASNMPGSPPPPPITISPISASAASGTMAAMTRSITPRAPSSSPTARSTARSRR